MSLESEPDPHRSDPLGWSPCPSVGEAVTGDPSPRLGAHAAAGVIGVGAWCRLARDGRPDSVSFAVGEFVDLADGRRVLLHEDRGFSIGWRGGAEPRMARVELREDVLNAVLPDDAEQTEASHDWVRLAALAQARGVAVAPAVLRLLPYGVEFDDDLRALLDD